MTRMIRSQSDTPPSERDLWRTPAKLFLDLQDHYFPFTIDLAATEDDKLCADFISPEQNALDPLTFWHQSRTSGGEVTPHVWGWCNPPFSLAEQFAFRATQERQHMGIVMLLPDTMEVEWMHRWVVPTVDELWAIKGRVSYDLPIGSTRTTKNQPYWGSVLAIWESGDYERTHSPYLRSFDQRTGFANVRGRLHIGGSA